MSANGHKVLKGKESMEVDLSDEMWVERRNLPTSEMQLQEEFNRIKVRMTGEKERLEEVNELAERCKKIETHIHTVDELIKTALTRKLNLFNDCEM